LTVGEERRRILIVLDLLKQSELQGVLDKAFSENGLSRTGNNFTYHCPFCSHRKRKLEVCFESPFLWQCWVCHCKGRGIRNLLIKMKCSSALMKEFEAIGIKETINRPISDKKEVPILKLPDEFKSLMAIEDTREFREAKRYASRRKITNEDVIKHNIGYCTIGRWKNRIIFPSYDKNNILNFFTGRSYYEDVYLKYDNCDAPKDIIGFENMVDFKFPVNLVEGPLDAIAVKRNVIPLFGTWPSQKLKTELIRYKPEVRIILDLDAKKQALNIAEWLLSAGVKVKLIEMKEKDAGVMGFSKISQLIRETDYLDFSRIMRLRLSV
jgi:hypothetical protein